MEDFENGWFTYGTRIGIFCAFMSLVLAVYVIYISIEKYNDTALVVFGSIYAVIMSINLYLELKNYIIKKEQENDN